MNLVNNKKPISAFLLILIGCAVVYSNNSGYIDIESIVVYFKDHRVIAPFLFVLIYGLLVAFFVPTLPMNLGAGFIWGMWLGGIITILGATLGSVLAFFVSRYLAHDYFNQKFNYGIWKNLRVSIEKSNWKIVAFTRINPAFPFGLTSYFFGLTPIKFKQFVISTALFIVPGAFIIAGIGYSIQGVTFSESNSHLMRNITLGSLLITIFLILTLFAKRYFTSSQKYNNLDPQL